MRINTRGSSLLMLLCFKICKFIATGLISWNISNILIEKRVCHNNKLEVISVPHVNRFSKLHMFLERP